MARTGTVTVAVLGTLFALTHLEVVVAKPVTANVFTTGVSNSGAAQSQVIENDGTIKGECAYVGPDGNTIKVAYRKPPNGQIQAESNSPNVDPVAALAACRRAAETASVAAQQSFQQINEMMRQQQQQFQALQQSFPIPSFFGFPNQFHIPGFGQF